MVNLNDDFIPSHEGVFTKEKDNICNLPKIADIEIHRINETGKYYLNFIEWVSEWNEGRWQEQEINEHVVRMLLSFCYPEHIVEVMSKDLGKGVRA